MNNNKIMNKLFKIFFIFAVAYFIWHLGRAYQANIPQVREVSQDTLQADCKKLGGRTGYGYETDFSTGSKIELLCKFEKKNWQEDWQIDGNYEQKDDGIILKGGSLSL